jgi:hypothetical protein
VQAGQTCVTTSGKLTRSHALRWADADRGFVEDDPVAVVIDFESARRRKLARANGYTG